MFHGRVFIGALHGSIEMNGFEMRPRESGPHLFPCHSPSSSSLLSIRHISSVQTHSECSWMQSYLGDAPYQYLRRMQDDTKSYAIFLLKKLGNDGLESLFNSIPQLKQYWDTPVRTISWPDEFIRIGDANRKHTHVPNHWV